MGEGFGSGVVVGSVVTVGSGVNVGEGIGVSVGGGVDVFVFRGRTIIVSSVGVASAGAEAVQAVMATNSARQITVNSRSFFLFNITIYSSRIALAHEG
jgi:hypothetical protein